MTMFHNGPNGPGKCSAKKSKCPFGGESGAENHFDNVKDAENAFAKSQGGTSPTPLKKSASKEARVKKDLSNLIDNDELRSTHGGIDGMSDKFTDTVKNNPEFKNELNEIVKNAGFDPDKHYVRAIISKDSLHGGNLHDMINFQAQEIDHDNYDWDAHDEGEEEDIEQTEKYYNQFLNEDTSNLNNPMIEVDYNGKKYTAFLDSDEEDRKMIYGD